MKIFLKQILDCGLEFNQMVTAKDLDLPEDVCHCLSPLAVHGEFQHAGDEVLAKFAVRGRYRLSCGRCLEDFDVEKTDRFELIFDVEPTTEFVEFTDDVRDELILVMTANPICRDDCKGICQGCGSNLNLEKCQCDTSYKLQDTGHM